MMNVMIVDDEPIIRIGLRTLIDWERNGFRLIGEAADGEEALRLIADNDVDLLVTDIRMPRMDGLELIRQAKRHSSDIGIVVLSCLDDFSFVKEAMKLGARDYILKPTMEPDELVAVLRTIATHLNEERREKARILELNDRLEQSKPYRLQAKIRSFFEHGIVDSDLENELFKEGRKLYSVLIRSMGSVPFVVRESELADVLVAVRLQENQHLLLLDCDRGVSSNEWYQLAFTVSEKLLRHWTDSAGSGPDNQPVIYVGPPLNDIHELPRRLDYHRMQIVSRFYGGSHGQVYMDEPQPSSGDIPLPTAARNNLLRAVAGGNNDAIRHYLQEMLEAIGAAKPDLPRLQDFIFETVGLVFGYARENGHAELHEMEQQYLSRELIASWSLFSDLCKGMDGFIRELCGSRDGMGTRREVQHPFIRKAIAFIKDHYSQNIGTADIAEYVKLSRSYLSDLYSKEVGESLTETLTRVRIEEACKLLTTTDKKIYEIAEDVGFNDSKTFTKTFKRMMGCSPKEYPASNK